MSRCSCLSTRETQIWGEGKLIVMTPSFDVIHKSILYTNEFGEGKETSLPFLVDSQTQYVSQMLPYMLDAAPSRPSSTVHLAKLPLRPLQPLPNLLLVSRLMMTSSLVYPGGVMVCCLLSLLCHHPLAPCFAGVCSRCTITTACCRPQWNRSQGWSIHFCGAHRATSL
jgi:hypothetical protein